MSVDKGMIKVLANFQLNQVISSLAINRPLMYVKRSKIVFKFRFFSVFFIHMNYTTSKNTKKNVVF